MSVRTAISHYFRPMSSRAAGVTALLVTFLAAVATVLIVIYLVTAFAKYQASEQSDIADSGELPRITDDLVPGTFIEMLSADAERVAVLQQMLAASWHETFVPMALETLTFSYEPDTTKALVNLLEEGTGQDFGEDRDRWFQWWWRQSDSVHSHYSVFKTRLYRALDRRFEPYFERGRETSIRLDEVRWGGVRQDGIPPLRYPTMLGADEADYLDDDDVVFGLAYNGDARAYPKRILAWHEMFIDVIGGEEYAGVYCTLCGAVILYRTVFGGKQHQLGTSGFLYRSNKLMYDKATQSLWSTTLGQPVVGPLVGQGIQLERSFVITTTWGEWRRRHPQSQVLSLETGYQRDYGEGVAYAEYFATDELMFTVPEIDRRLANKAEILALQFPDFTDKTAAIHTEFLKHNPLFHYDLDGQKVVILTDLSGASRVYHASNVVFATYDGDSQLTDTQGREWLLEEESLVAQSGEQTGEIKIARLPAHRAFWFGWQAVHRDSALIM